MAENVRFESSPANTEELGLGGTHQNVQRASHSGASLNKSGSFREGSEGRIIYASTFSRGSSPLFVDVYLVSQCLILEPFPMVDQKYPKIGELKKALGIPLGTSAGDGNFGANHAKFPQQVILEELKRFRSSVVDVSTKARYRLKKLDESLHKLSKYQDALISKKHQRSALLMNERSGGPYLKMSSQLHRNSSDLSVHRVEDRAKNASLNKRFHSSVTELRGENQGNMPMRQSLITGKDRDSSRDVGEGSDPIEEKVQRLPAGGEGWEKKIKRKRSIGTVVSRPVEGDGEVRGATQKVKIDPSLQLSDTQTSRSGLNGPNGMNKSDSSSLPTSSNNWGFSKDEQEKASFQRDFSPASAKDRAIARANNKLTVREDITVQNPTPLTKGKASRTPRSSPLMAASSPSNPPCGSGGLESWEQSPSVPKVRLMGISSYSNRKRVLSSSSSLPPMTHWSVQRPQKMPRSRRANVASPMLSHDEIPTSSEVCASDGGPKMMSMSRGFSSGIQQLKVKLENVSSPARLSDSEESGAGDSHETRLKDKRTGSIELVGRDVVPVQNIGSSGGPMKKIKMTCREDIGDSVQREGRCGQGPSFAQTSISPSREKLENSAGSKLHRSVRTGFDKSGSKTGRPPLKKLSERKTFTRPGKMPAGSTPDFSGESDDDQEELLSAASFASSASYSACTGNLWKRMEPIFASISSKDISFLEQQVKSLEEPHSFSKKFNSCIDLMGNLDRERNPMSQSYGAEDYNTQGQYALKELCGAPGLVEHDIISMNGRLDSRMMKVIPITQRLLASLIVEDENMAEGDFDGRDCSFQHSVDNHISCLAVNGNLTDNNYSEFNYHVLFGVQIPDGLGMESSCNGMMNKSVCSQSNCDIYNPDGHSQLHRERVCIDIPVNGSTDDEGYEIQKRALLELHSIGLYPENVPDLTDGENDPINNEVSDLHKKLTQKVDTKSVLLGRITQSVRKGGQFNRRDLEQIAMDKHIEAAYRKQLATRATYASKSGIPKVPKHVAMTFTKRALDRCRKFEDTGKSCFSESPFIEALSASPPHGEELLDCTNLPQIESGLAGPFSNRIDRSTSQNDPSSFETNGTLVKNMSLPDRGKKKEVLLDDIGGKPSLRILANLGNTFSGGAKGKRSERDRDPQAKNGCQNNARAERKTKAKPNQRSTQLSTSINGFITNSLGMETSGALPSNSNVNSATIKEKESTKLASLDLPMDSIDDLDVPGWLNLDGDGLQDIDSAVPLDIPMDDLADVFL
ncbi:hypothetical protein SAY87_006122 [Trapa incisa]|uniref:Uncharacterized protein n=1 Tax=Trapa incisa TaxID=236973 RepID=A0AAN7K775_9MYRT|nr:hypothetical protein SAY87_006122 [Trapa incisa]